MKSKIIVSLSLQTFEKPLFSSQIYYFFVLEKGFYGDQERVIDNTQQWVCVLILVAQKYLICPVLVVVVQSVRKSWEMIVKMHQVTLPLQSAKAVQKKLTPLHSTAQLSFQSYTGSSVLPQGLAVREVLT